MINIRWSWDRVIWSYYSQLPLFCTCWEPRFAWSKKTSKLRVTGLCEGNPPVTGEFPAQRASNAENVSIWWHYRVLLKAPGASKGPMVPKSCLGHIWEHTASIFMIRKPYELKPKGPVCALCTVLVINFALGALAGSKGPMGAKINKKWWHGTKQVTSHYLNHWWPKLLTYICVT